MGVNEEPRRHEEEQLLSNESQGQIDEQSLLDAVLRETMGNANHAALELIFEVARQSQYSDTTQLGAVEELVRAIMKESFGSRKIPKRLISRIACSLVEDPEAAVRIERLWQEARASG